jgi:hypothetical protein
MSEQTFHSFTAQPQTESTEPTATSIYLRATTMTSASVPTVAKEGAKLGDQKRSFDEAILALDAIGPFVQSSAECDFDTRC